MEELKIRIEMEAESCLKGGLIEGLSRMEQLYHDINIMRDCGLIDAVVADELRAIVDNRYETGFIRA